MNARFSFHTASFSIHSFRPVQVVVKRRLVRDDQVLPLRCRRCSTSSVAIIVTAIPVKRASLDFLP